MVKWLRCRIVTLWCSGFKAHKVLYMLSKLHNLRTHESCSKCPVSSEKCRGGNLKMSLLISKRKGRLFLENQGSNLTWEICTLGPRGQFQGDRLLPYLFLFFCLWIQMQSRSEAYTGRPPGWQCDSRSNSILSRSVSLLHTDHPWEIIWAGDRTVHPATRPRPVARTSRTTIPTAPPNPPAGCAPPRLLPHCPPWTTTTSSLWRSNQTSNPSPGKSLWILTSPLLPLRTYPSSPCADKDVVLGLGLWREAVCPGPKTEQGALATRYRWRSGAQQRWRSRRRATTRRWRKRRGRCSTWRGSEPASTTSQTAPPRARRSRKRPWETKTHT